MDEERQLDIAMTRLLELIKVDASLAVSFACSENPFAEAIKIYQEDEYGKLREEMKSKVIEELGL